LVRPALQGTLWALQSLSVNESMIHGYYGWYDSGCVVDMDLDKMKSDIIISLFELDAVQFGNFILKSKTTSPVYIDFRGIISSPALMVL